MIPKGGKADAVRCGLHSANGVTSIIIIAVGEEEEEGGKKVKKVATRGFHRTAVDRSEK